MTYVYIYVAGPISKGNQFSNTAAAMEVAHQLLDNGFRPFIPHLFCFMDIVKERSYDEWLQLDLDWLLKCDALLRLQGISPGADKEVEFARHHNIPVYNTVNDLILGHLQNVKAAIHKPS